VVRLSERAARILDDGGSQIFSFGRASRPVDGLWSLVAFSIPEQNRAARDSLRKQLRWLRVRAALRRALGLPPRSAPSR
jgi:phenylacetic acid degradation operon negative regulatory protein